MFCLWPAQLDLPVHSGGILFFVGLSKEKKYRVFKSEIACGVLICTYVLLNNYRIQLGIIINSTIIHVLFI